MDSAANFAVTTVYQFFFEQVRVYVVDNIDDGDVSLGQLKDQLQTEFERLNAKIDKIMNAPVLAAQDHLLSGLSYLQYDPNDADGAKRIFERALDESVRGFRTATTFELKTLAVKIRVLSTLHIHDYFDGNPKRAFIENELSSIWNNFTRLPEVESSIRDEFNGSMLRMALSSKTRKEILQEAAGVRSHISSLLGRRLMLKDDKGKEVHLEKMKPQTLTGHSASIQDFCVDNGLLYSGSWDGIIKVWDISSSSSGSIPSEPMQTLGQSSSVLALCIDNGRLYSGLSDSTIKVWDILSVESSPDEPIQKLIGHSDMVSALCAHNGRLYSGSRDSTIQVWDISSSENIPEEPIQILSGHTREVKALCVHDGRLFSGSEDKSIKVWDISSQYVPHEPNRTLTGHSYSVEALCVYNSRLYSGSLDQTIKVWDISSESIPHEPIQTILGHSGMVYSLCSHNGRLYSGCMDTTINVWDISSGSTPSEPIQTLTGHSELVYALCAHNGRLYSGSSTGVIKVWIS